MERPHRRFPDYQTDQKPYCPLTADFISPVGMYAAAPIMVDLWDCSRSSKLVIPQDASSLSVSDVP